MSRNVGWGILGCGKIAHKFARAVGSVSGTELVAAGSRSDEKAQAFAEEFKIPKSYGSYEALVEDGDVDVVYVATPHPMHRNNSILALEAGKAVLCEKPFAVTASEAREVVALAEKKGLFLMEAMWTRFLPTMARIRQILNGGLIGEVRIVQADFGFRSDWHPQGRLLNPDLAGGALLDVGVYTAFFVSMVFGQAPERIAAQAFKGDTGVDEQCCAVLSYPGGGLAVVTPAVRTRTPQEATIMGTDGWIRLESQWYGGSPFVLHQKDRRRKRYRIPTAKNGFQYEVEEVVRCLGEGRKESEILPWDETIRVMAVLDGIRSQIDLIYPWERQDH